MVLKRKSKTMSRAALVARKMQGFKKKSVLAVITHEHLGAAYHAMVFCHGGALLSAKSEASRSLSTPIPEVMRIQELLQLRYANACHSPKLSNTHHAPKHGLS